MTNPKIKSVRIERTGCEGPCPIYSAEADSNGTVNFHGELFVPKIGEYTWTIPIERLDKLLWFLKKANYFSLKDRYDEFAVTCHPSCITSVALSDGTHKEVVHDYGDGSAPEILRYIERDIDITLGVSKFLKEPVKNNAADK